MAVFRRALAVAAILSPGTAAAEGNCTVVDVDFFPAKFASTGGATCDESTPCGAPFTCLPGPPAPSTCQVTELGIQMVAWVETTGGTYVDTIFITQQTGTFGIGNRPGRYDFNSGPNWPYGRRPSVLPVWAHRHGLSWDQVGFQNDDENNLSHPFNQSSREMHFCRPLQRDEPSWDALSCASQVFTDKGVMKGAGTSLYPPRNDIARAVPDDPIVDMFDVLNPFDAVSQATPTSGAPATFSWPVPETLPFGNYVLFVEVSREFDMNQMYNPTIFPPPGGIPWAEYGLPYRGQPSVVYKMPFSIQATPTTATTSDYIGYGNALGANGDITPPDGTITEDVPGSGASRLQLLDNGGTSYRLRLVSKPQNDVEPPAAPGEAQLVSATSRAASIAFIAPGDDGMTGKAQKYEIRYLVGETVTDANFTTALQLAKPVVPTAAGSVQLVNLDGLLPQTEYSVGIRALDDCRNASPLTVLSFTTPERELGDVDACFIATAAYGSVMAADVDMLRRFRDSMLRKTVLGELAVETYYTFGPAVAGVVGESDLLRATARDALAPIVARVRAFRF